MDKVELIRSRRRTLGLEVTREGRVIVRVPLRASAASIERFVQEHAEWIQKAQARQRARLAAHPEPDEAGQAVLMRRAREELPPKVAYYAQRMGLQPTGMTITSARTRFGSCSPKNRLCFSWRLMDYPEAAIDYVVVHELAHIVHKNHGPQFWALVERYMPDYRARRALLRE
ncbi:MAG TPA: M48 family metallopeptidase [Candidatus Agathobaculum merdavium]|nr:M48 family metallopeptidase [Candidatus Agathobaculum merdavium]